MPSSSATASSPDSPVSFQHLPPRWEPTPARPRLPIGVGILAVAVALLGLMTLLGGLLFLLAYIVPAYVPPSLEIFTSIGLYGAGILVVLGAGLLRLATDLWDQETWALWVTILLVFGMAAYLFFTASISVLFLIVVVLFVYLISVRRYFY